MMIAAYAQAGESRPYVLLFHSYHVGMPWADGITAGLAESLAEQAEVVVVQADIKRFPDPGRGQAILANLTQKIAACRPAVVVTADEYAFALVDGHRDILGPDIPVVFGGLNHWDGRPRTGTTGVVEAIDLVGTVALAFRLHPRARRLVVVNDGTETGAANRAVFAQRPPDTGGRPVLWLGDGSFAETEQALAALSPHDDVLLLLSWNRDVRGGVRSYEEAATRARAVCPAPIYGVWSFYLGHGIVGGRLLDARVHGGEMGALVARILAGARSDDLPVVQRCTSQLALDQRELERFQVASALIPADAVYVNRPSSIWRDYGYLILAGLVVLLLQAATIIGLAWSMVRRRRIEVRLRDSEERLRRLALNSRDIIYRLDLATGLYDFINPAAETITGWPLDEICSTPDFATRIIRPDRLEWVRAQYGALRRGEIADHYEYPIIRPDGGERWLHERNLLIRDAQGRPTALEGVVTDVTARREAEARLRQSQRLDAVGQLAGGVAHDLNNVLTAVIGHADLLERRAAGQPELLHHAGIITASAQRAAATVRNLQLFARGRSSSATTCSLNQTIEEAMRLLEHGLDRRITVSAAIDPDATGHVALAPDDLQQVLVNLALNARDAMPAGGTLTISTCARELDGVAAARLGVIPGRGIEVVVADNGVGMSPEVRERIFEPFFTTKGLARGSGLGLAIVHGLVRGVGGGIHADSTVGQGTRMRLWLPVVAPAPAGKAAIDAGTGVSLISPAPVRDLRILLVDDERIVVDVVGRLLESRGHRVHAFTDPLEAVAWFTQDPRRVDVALLDGNMPGLSGWHCYTKLAQLRPGLPAVALTGLLTHEAIGAWNQVGVRLIISKPVSPADLDSLLARAVAGT